MKILIMICLTTVLSALSFSDYVSSYLPLGEDGKIKIPAHIKHVKLDIGLSYNAPHSQYWLTHEEDLWVFGFEPNPSSVNLILQGAKKQHPLHSDPLETKFIGKTFFLIPCALGNVSNQTLPFYIAENDCGCSSLFKPKFFGIKEVINVPVFKLSDFFKIFPFDTHPVIDFIKVDAQGADLDIIRGAELYLCNRVVFVTLEAEDSQYEKTSNAEWLINSYMKEMGFIRVFLDDTTDPTFINSKFLDYAKIHNVKVYQKG